MREGRPGDDVYERLREFLDGFPLGFPRSPSGTEMEILHRLFSPEEAELFLHLSPLPEEAGEVARRAEMDPRSVEKLLEEMSRRGLAFRVKREGKVLYNAVPFMIGLYEYSVKKMDGELAGLYRRYYEEVYVREMAASGVPGFKVVPLEEGVLHADLTLFPYLHLEKEVRRARKIAVAECVCRKEARLLGEGCDHPLETCLSFGAAAEYYIENGMGREIDAEEALEILRRADEAGLVHAGVNTVHLSNICNCCPCCCLSMKGITRKGLEKHHFMNALFVAVVDADLCTACGVCADRCPVGAMEVEEVARVDVDRCLGCGLCAGGCPGEAVTMRLRENIQKPYNRVLDLGMAIMEGKKGKGRTA